MSITSLALAFKLWMLILITGQPGALLPGIAFRKFSWLMGHGEPPLVPLVVYLSGSACFAYMALSRAGSICNARS